MQTMYSTGFGETTYSMKVLHIVISVTEISIIPIYKGPINRLFKLPEAKGHETDGHWANVSSLKMMRQAIGKIYKTGFSVLTLEIFIDLTGKSVYLSNSCFFKSR